MAEKENIFTDEFPDNKEEPSEFTKIPDLGDPADDKKPEKIVISDDGHGKKHPKRTVVIVGAVIVGVIIMVSYFGVAEFLEGETFDASVCNFGVKSDFFTTRCMTQQEQDISKTLNPPPVKPTEVTRSDGTPFKDVSSTSDKVEVTKSKDPIGYFMVTTDDDWYGDFVDFRKIPNKIEKSGDLKVNFRCFTDEFQGTSTYFGTFRNQIDSDLTVEVYINGLEVESQTTTVNKALILEGSCYGHES